MGAPHPGFRRCGSQIAPRSLAAVVTDNTPPLASDITPRSADPRGGRVPSPTTGATPVKPSSLAMDTHAAVCAKVRPMVAHADDKAYFGNSVRARHQWPPTVVSIE